MYRPRHLPRCGAPPRRALRALGFAGAVLLWLAAPAAAQLDPLLFMKRVPPTVIVAVDTSFRMLDDGTGNYYDPQTYVTAGDPVAEALRVPAAASTYRRIYRDLAFTSVQDGNTKYMASGIAAVPSTTSAYATFYDVTRLEIAKRGIRRAIEENPSGPRWGLVKLRQSNAAWRTGNNCDRPVVVSSLPDINDPCAGGSIGIYAPTVAVPNGSIEGSSGTVYAANLTSSGSSTLLPLLARPVGDALGLIPAGLDTATEQDRPLVHALEDARQQATNFMFADNACRGCRNAIVVLVTGGRDDGPNSYRATHDAATTASTFLNVTAGGVTRRVPIYVVAVKAAEDDRESLERIAVNSGGRYFHVTDAAGVARAVNLAVQAGYARWVDFTQGRESEYLPVNPIIGTVNLSGAMTATGGTLPDSETDIQTKEGVTIPLRSNVMITAGFAVGGTDSGAPGMDGVSPGMDGRLRAFRNFKPVADGTKVAGYKFVKDGTPLWPDRDGRPWTAGLARTPANPADRNIYTFLPGSGVVSFDADHASAFATALGVGALEAESLVQFVRNLPIGAVIGSTPALMDPPSLDPPPDGEYGYASSDDDETYAGRLRNRRAMIFFGANDGMIHAVDARTGFEVWAFIPYNLLPKLRTLRDGQPVEQFDYFVDSSPKIAEVKMAGKWRSLLLIGESMGGTFYQAFDVSEAGMGGPPPDSDDYGGVLGTFRDPEQIEFLWAFPAYGSFDPTYTGAFSVTDGWPGGKVKFYGDLKNTATPVEKGVGFTWSDPAVGPLTQDRSVNVAVVGSGYFPAVTLPSRNGSTAGRSLYLIDLATGRPLASPAACASGASGTGCLDVGDVGGDGRKNALQADPTAASVAGGTYITKAYAGDVDGNYWRFDFTTGGTITKTPLLPAKLADEPIYASSALMLVGSSSQYVFFATGSDLLPTTTTGGSGPFTLYGLLDQGGTAIIKLSRQLEVSNDKGTLLSIERPGPSPSVAGDIVFFTTTTESFALLCRDFSSNLYAFTYQGGAAYDTDASGSVTKDESPVIRTTTGRATAPFVVDQHLYYATTSNEGATVEAFGDPEDFNNGVGQVGVRILSWREIR